VGGRGLILAWLASAGFAVAVIEAQEPAAKRSARDGVYSERQAGRGRRVYGRSCEHCHGASLEGNEPREIPALVFEPFMRQWNGRTVAELFEHVSRSMPADDRGSLTPRAYGDVVAFVLESNGFPAGPSDLPEKPEELAAITIERLQP
jgi:S-disulfanyl-L-cysteine oxidoreductase SoxD